MMWFGVEDLCPESSAAFWIERVDHHFPHVMRCADSGAAYALLFLVHGEIGLPEDSLA